MNILFLLIVIAVIISNTKAEKKKREAKQAAQRREAFGSGPHTPPPQGQPLPRRSSYSPPSAPVPDLYGEFPGASSQAQAREAAPRKSAPGKFAGQPGGSPAARSGSMDYISKEGQGTRFAPMRSPITPHSDDHIVQATCEGGHTHVEGMTAPCPPSKPAAPRPAKTPAAPVPGDISRLRAAIIAAEVLGRPRALQRRWG